MQIPYRVAWRTQDGRETAMIVYASSRSDAMQWFARRYGVAIEFSSCEREDQVKNLSHNNTVMFGPTEQGPWTREPVKNLSDLKIGYAKSLKLNDVADTNIVVEGYISGQSEFGEYIIMDVELPDGSKNNVITSASVVLRTLPVLPAEDFPVQARFTRTPGNVWDIVPWQ